MRLAQVVLMVVLVSLSGCSKAGDEFTGEWVEVNDPSSRVIIKRDGESYVWEEFNSDGHSTWDADYEDGKLKLAALFGHSVASIDDSSKHLVLRSGGKTYEFKRK